MIPRFRVWDKKRKLMTDEVVVIDLYHEYIGYLYPSEIVQGEIVSRLPINDVIIMQSTGLQDKNGKEIFEGIFKKNVRLSSLPRLLSKEVKLMTKKELQAQINFLVSELQRLRNGYNKLSDEAFNDKIDKIKCRGMYQKTDEKAERYGGLLLSIKDILNQESVDEDDAVYRLDGITQLIDDWYEQEIIK